MPMCCTVAKDMLCSTQAVEAFPCEVYMRDQYWGVVIARGGWLLCVFEWAVCGGAKLTCFVRVLAGYLPPDTMIYTTSYFTPQLYRAFYLLMLWLKSSAVVWTAQSQIVHCFGSLATVWLGACQLFCVVIIIGLPFTSSEPYCNLWFQSFGMRFRCQLKNVRNESGDIQLIEVVWSHSMYYCSLVNHTLEFVTTAGWSRTLLFF